MLRNVFLSLIVLTSLSTHAEFTASGPPSEDDYRLFCKNYGAKGEPSRERCEAGVRIKRGLGTCDEIEWSYSCEVDVMSDQKTCTIYGRESNLFAFAKQGKLYFGVTGTSYPGSSSVIRIDQNKAISFTDDTRTTQAQNQAIERQIKNGTTLRTRFINWPYAVQVDSTLPICNLPSLLEQMKSESKAVK